MKRILLMTSLVIVGLLFTTCDRKPDDKEPEVVIDPTIYDIGEVYSDYYYNSFSSSGDWTENTTSDYSATISNDIYTITNYSSENYWVFSTSAAAMPSSSLNYDLDIQFIVYPDNGGYGDGLFWAKDPDAFNYYYFLTSPSSSSTGYYALGKVENGTSTSWLTESWISGGHSTEYNHLTIRKYGNNYYMFLNEILIKTHSYEGDFGGKFGFWVGPSSTMYIADIGIWTISSKKSAQGKERINTPRVLNSGEAFEDSNIGKSAK
jgi:hypothetical protein